LKEKYLFYFFCGLVIWIILIMAAPVFVSINIPEAKFIGRFIYFFFQPTCHQIPERSFFINGEPLAVCVRCFAFYTGGLLFLGYILIRKIQTKLNLKLIAILSFPVIIDFLMEKIGIYQNIEELRFVTGLLLGMVFFSLLLYSLEWKPKNSD